MYPEYDDKATNTSTSGTLITALFMASALMVGLFASDAAHAERIKDLTTVQGVRSNELIGYGLVVGLNGTGDSSNSSPSLRRCVA